MWNTSARARLPVAATELYPLGYSGYGGVAIIGTQLGSGLVAGLPSVSARLIAVIGRQKP